MGNVLGQQSLKSMLFHHIFVQKSSPKAKQVKRKVDRLGRDLLQSHDDIAQLEMKEPLPLRSGFWFGKWLKNRSKWINMINI